MPEGPEIMRARDQLATVLEQATITKIEFAFNHLKSYQGKLKNKTIVEVKAKGKAMLIGFANGYTIYSHNQLYGKWIIAKDGKLPVTNRQLRLAIYNSRGAAFLYSASDIAVFKNRELADHPYLNKLGVELLDQVTTAEQVTEQLLRHHQSRRSLMNVLQDQSILAGIGNYLCCEILHITALHPETRLCDLDKRQIKKLAKNCISLTRQSYETGGITNSLTRAKKLAKQGKSFEDYRFNVYRRQGLPCYKCGDAIVKDTFSGKMGYCCLKCQY
jgi:endonuclease-8